jgi:hypothetical protein
MANLWPRRRSLKHNPETDFTEQSERRHSLRNLMNAEAMRTEEVNMDLDSLRSDLVKRRTMIRSRDYDLPDPHGRGDHPDGGHAQSGA